MNADIGVVLNGVGYIKGDCVDVEVNPKVVRSNKTGNTYSGKIIDFGPDRMTIDVSTPWNGRVQEIGYEHILSIKKSSRDLEAEEKILKQFKMSEDDGK